MAKSVFSLSPLGQTTLRKTYLGILLGDLLALTQPPVTLYLKGLNSDKAQLPPGRIAARTFDSLSIDSVADSPYQTDRPEKEEFEFLHPNSSKKFIKVPFLLIEVYINGFDGLSARLVPP